MAGIPFLEIKGEMAARVRGFDWATTSLGPLDTWPQSLKSAVGIVLFSPVPIVMLWGEDGIMIYNDAYAVFAGKRHPGLLGSKVREGWPEVADFNDNVMKVGLAGGTLAYCDQQLVLDRHGKFEPAWLNLDYSPIPDESGRPAGVMAIVVETTERVLAEQARRDSEERFREIANAAPVIIWIADTTMACTWFNTEALDFTGRPMEKEQGFGWADNVHPDDAERVLTNLANAYETREPFSLDFRMRRNDGEWRTLAETAVPRFAMDGTFLGFIGSCMDVTEQRKTAEALRLSEEQLRLAAEYADVGLWDVDVVNDVLYWPPHVNTMFGIPIDEQATLKEFRARIHPDDRRRVVGAILDACDPEKHTSYDIEYRIVRRDSGEMRWVSVRGRAAFDAQGACTRMLGIVIDVTERKEIESRIRELNETLERRVAERTAALEQSEKNIRSIFETSHLYQGLLSADGTLLYANATSLAGIKSNLSDVLGKPFWDTPWFTATPGMTDAVKAAVKSVALGHAEDIAMTLNLPVGARTFEFSMRPVKEDSGKVVAMVPEAVDVTARVKAEAALQQAQKMEAIGNLTGGIAHDFNNLLQGVAGSLDLIRRRPDDVARVRRWAEAGLQAAERGAKLTAQLLAFSRSQKLEVKPLDLSALLEEMRELLLRTLGPSVRVTLDLDAADTRVLCDETQLEMAVLNLAINARDAMVEGGDLLIGTRRVLLANDPDLPPGEYMELTVSDTGTGMPADVISRAFDPFFTTKGVGKGTGLGLSQVYGMARQAGGHARIRSSPGQGTTVSLFLRLTEADAARDLLRERKDEAVNGAPATVLIVDDDPSVRQFLADSLESFGYEVLQAEDGTAGLALLDRSQPDVMIVDYAMPGMTGAEVAQQARARRAKLPILFASGYAETSALDALAGETAILRKPFRVNELQEAVKKALQR